MLYTPFTRSDVGSATARPDLDTGKSVRPFLRVSLPKLREGIELILVWEYMH